MSNSSLICCTNISPNKTSPRNHTIDTITIHCMAGNMTIENCGAMFAKSATAASSNYGIGSDGRIALYVEEKNRSWCSSNSANDHRAITIEVANDGGAETGWHVSAAAYKSLINLCVDVCQRNGIKELKWQGDKSLIGQVNKQNMTVHRWFAAKACPGDYLYNLHGQIAAEVNKRLNDFSQPSDGFFVKVRVKNLNIRKEPKKLSKKMGAIKDKGTYTITEKDSSGNWGKLKSGAGWICIKTKYVKYL